MFESDTDQETCPHEPPFIDGSEFEKFLFRTIEYLKGLEDQEDAIGYLNTMLKYVFSAGRDITKDEYEKIAEKIETTYPEGSEVVRPPLS